VLFKLSDFKNEEERVARLFRSKKKKKKKKDSTITVVLQGWFGHFVMRKRRQKVANNENEK